ncbi:MAG: UDP-N-acetylmuramoyl-L-alanyl-D-glutamate--2,6-diaminopimelate ligase [Chloroflexi bacterium]|nr:UDP-N-acetylmuramoyl-L-alanyl-D-glutamate--2,6-diaminopimelate ligase [Chloroflexota bacterium]
MKLREMVDALDTKEIIGNPDTEIGEIVIDSRQARPGALFVAIPGTQRDGHAFIPDVVGRGAAAVVCERPSSAAGKITQVVVPASRPALALLSSAFYGFPGRKLKVIGVTGTDGKTTTSSLIGAILDAAGKKTGLITTVSATIGGRASDTGLHTTTPDPPEVQRFLAQMVAEGMEYAIIETTSHGLDQDRTLGTAYDVAVVTNVTHEHLDYHRTYEAYLAAKGKLFAQLTAYRKDGVLKVSVTNADDTSFDYLRRFPADLSLTYALENPAGVGAREIELSPKGTRFIATTPNGDVEITSPLLGKFNVYNMLAAIAAAVSQGISLQHMAEGLRSFRGVTGRMEPIDGGQDFDVLVDFAHTPRSLEQALTLGRSLTRGRVIVVFGCAGLRDRGKRPLMGEISGRLADLVIVTAEDPRTEGLDEINRQIEEGLLKAGRRQGEGYRVIGDRTDAIAFALGEARSGDLVMVTGKGHEKSMCFGETEHPWSDQETIRKILEKGRFNTA